MLLKEATVCRKADAVALDQVTFTAPSEKIRGRGPISPGSRRARPRPCPSPQPFLADLLPIRDLADLRAVKGGFGGCSYRSAGAREFTATALGT